MPYDSFEDRDHLKYIVNSGSNSVRATLIQYEKDGTTLREPWDLTPFMEVNGSYVSRNSTAAVPAKFSCKLSIELDWTEIILAPGIYIVDNLSGDTSFWRLGLYFVETPVVMLSNPNEYQVIAYDVLSMYNTDVVHTYEILEGQNPIESMRTGLLGNAIDWGNVLPGTSTDSGNTRWQLERTDQTIRFDRVWAITENHTYLSIANDLLDTIGFRKLYTDRGGAFVSEPLRLLRDRSSVYDIDSEDLPSIVALETKFRKDTWKVPNTWQGISGNANRIGVPDYDDGLYTLRNRNVGPTSIERRGRPVNRIIKTDSANQLALISVVEFEAEKDFSSIEQIEMLCVPLPVFWHETVATIRVRELGINPPIVNEREIPTFTREGRLIHPNIISRTFNNKMVARDWKLPLDGSNMKIQFDVLNELPQ